MDFQGGLRILLQSANYKRFYSDQDLNRIQTQASRAESPLPSPAQPSPAPNIQGFLNHTGKQLQRETERRSVREIDCEINRLHLSGPVSCSVITHAVQAEPHSATSGASLHVNIMQRLISATDCFGCLTLVCIFSSGLGARAGCESSVRFSNSPCLVKRAGFKEMCSQDSL